jgi:murein DD-endopeptidase MepM/ murein hydrolase activator NlpD
MLRFASDCRAPTGLALRGLTALVAAASVLAGGCSSGVTRFDYPFFGLTESGASGPPPRMRAEGPAPMEPVSGGRYAPQGGTYGQSYSAPPGSAYGNGYGTAPAGGYGNGYGHGAPPNTYGNGYGAPAAGSYGPPPMGNTSGNYGPPQTGNPSSNIAVAALPKADGPPRLASAPVSVAPPPRSVETAPATAPVVPAARSTAAAPVAPDAQAGGEIEVKQGDTLYSLAKHHRVSMSELMRINALTELNLKPGQKLSLPAGAKVARAAPRTQPAPPVAEARPAAAAPAVAAATATAPTAPVAAPAAPAGWTDSYTIRPGDSLYGIARKRGVTVAELQRFNGITDVHKMQPGTVLKLPSETSDAGKSAVAAPPSSTVAVAPQQAGAGPRPTVLNAPRTAAVETKSSVPGAQPVVGSAAPNSADKHEQPAQAKVADGRLRWPVKGRIISSFGAQSDGTQNDGVNLAVPAGTEVLAAETGVVAYAGSEVRGYGNLVLVRHDNGWVTAYAHNDQLLVQRGDRVRRGQVLAKAGRTGSVDQPQVHFELRQGPKPVDPLPHMERM